MLVPFFQPAGNLRRIYDNFAERLRSDSRRSFGAIYRMRDTKRSRITCGNQARDIRACITLYADSMNARYIQRQHRWVVLGCIGLIRSTSAWITHLGRRQVAEPRVGALQWCLLNDSVSAAVTIGHVVGSHAVLSVERASVIRDASNWMLQYKSNTLGMSLGIILNGRFFIPLIIYIGNLFVKRGIFFPAFLSTSFLLLLFIVLLKVLIREMEQLKFYLSFVSLCVTLKHGKIQRERERQKISVIYTCHTKWEYVLQRYLIGGLKFL